MPDREKVAKDLADIGAWIAGRIGFEMARNFMRTIDDAVAMIKEQEDLGTELTNAMELIHRKNERIEKLLKEQEEIVRCKDCAYALFKEGVVQPGQIVCTKPFTEQWQKVKPNNWYCADGER